MSNTTGKDIIYIDVDDEITAIIDKVRSSHDRIVALVLPKRATVFQSIVNMKLLKRSADAAKKHLVLITSEAGLMPLAAMAEVYVAKTPQSKPEIPTVPGMPQPDDETSIAEPADTPARQQKGAPGQAADADKQDDAASESERQLDKNRPIGEYARSAATGPLTPPFHDEETIELDDDTENELLTPAQAAKKAAKPKKRFSIPNFDKFRLWILLGGVGLVLLIVFWYVAAVRMPKAAIAIKTDSIAVPASLTAVLDANAEKANIDSGVVPAFVQKTQKTQTQEVAASGEKDNGQKASGSVTASIACSADVPQDVPAGTGVSAGGLTFITQSKLSFSPQLKNGKCQYVASSKVVAQQSGEKYNLAARSDYKIAGRSELSVADSSGMTGGTTELVKVVSQADIDGAKQKLAGQDTSAIKQDLQQSLLAKSYYAVEDTFVASDPEVSASAQVGDEADSVTLTQNITYSMLGAKLTDLQNLVANTVSNKIDPKKQQILSYGFDKAIFNIEEQDAAKATVSMQTTIVAGTDLDLNAIKKQVAGKKANQAKEIIKKNPGVTDVTVEYSPFWVSSIPKNTDKITLDVEKPQTSNGTSQSN